MRVTKSGVVLVSALATAAISSGLGASIAGATTTPPDSGAIVVDGTVPADSATAGTIPDPAECAAGLTLTDGTLTVATGDPAYPPYVLDDDPESGQGFEAAIAYAVAALMGFGMDQVEWVRTPFDAAIAPGPKDFDFNLQQFSITPEREEVVSFSIPYYTSTQAIFGYADSAAAGASSLTDLQGLRIGAATGTTSLTFAEDIIQPDSDVQIFNSNADAVAALDAQQIDAVVTDLYTALYITSGAEGMEGGTIFGQFSTTDDTAGESWGLLFEKDNPLVECANNALLMMRQSGALEQITDEWMTASIEVPFIGIDG